MTGMHDSGGAEKVELRWMPAARESVGCKGVCGLGGSGFWLGQLHGYSCPRER